MISSYLITPTPAPRMTQSDKWNQRPAVVRYRAFRDAVKEPRVNYWSGCKVTFYIKMPSWWSKKKRAEWDGKPHMNKPDIDNLLKALLDAIYDDDAHIWAITAEKRWAFTPSITVEDVSRGT